MLIASELCFEPPNAAVSLALNPHFEIVNENFFEGGFCCAAGRLPFHSAGKAARLKGAFFGPAGVWDIDSDAKRPARA